MKDSKLRSRLKAQLTKFSSELGEGLSKPMANFAHQMLFGIQASQDVKLSNIARSLKEDIPLINASIFKATANCAGCQAALKSAINRFCVERREGRLSI